MRSLSLPRYFERPLLIVQFRLRVERETVWSLSRQPSVRTLAGLRLHRTSLRENESRQPIARFSKILFHSHYRCFRWSGRRDSDPRLSPWQGDTLPLSHSRKHKLLYQINRQKATIFRYKNKKFFGFTFINCRFSNLLYIVCFYGIINVLPNADVVELADTQDLGSCTRVCRFDSCHPHQLLKKRTLTGSFFNRWLVDGFATMKCDACIAFFYS